MRQAIFNTKFSTQNSRKCQKLLSFQISKFSIIAKLNNISKI